MVADETKQTTLPKCDLNVIVNANDRNPNKSEVRLMFHFQTESAKVCTSKVIGFISLQKFFEPQINIGFRISDTILNGIAWVLE